MNIFRWWKIFICDLISVGLILAALLGRRKSAEDAQWTQLLAQLQHLCVAYLTTAPEPAA
jgi:hypothetical protein